jgi:hypothetical protein
MTLNAATLLTLLIQPLGVVLTCALLDILAPTKSPAHPGVCFPHLVASVAATGLLGVGGSRGTVAFTAVGGIQMLGRVVVEFYGLGINDTASLGGRAKANLVDTVCDSVLLLPGDIHDIKGEQLARHSGKGHVEMDLHPLS